MKPWANRKRLWEDNFSQDLQFKRHASTFTASSPQQLSLLPPPAGRYFYDQRRLPPLFGPLRSSSADTITANKQQPIKHPRSLELDISASCTSADVHPRSGTDPTPGTGALVCCPLDWKSQTFSNTCSSLRTLVADLTILNTKIRTLMHIENNPSNKVSCFLYFMALTPVTPCSSAWLMALILSGSRVNLAIIIAKRWCNGRLTLCIRLIVNSQSI
jgi:hypothetical protein